VPDLGEDEEIIQDYMVRDFTNALRHALNDAGNTNGEDPWTMLVGIDTYLYMVDAGMGVHRCQDGLMAIGSGCPYAIASLYTTKQLLIAEHNIGTIHSTSLPKLAYTSLWLALSAIALALRGRS
jgi:ATP-dependent protease HslVU (ClpYQ) peptidase subunit